MMAQAGSSPLLQSETTVSAVSVSLDIEEQFAAVSIEQTIVSPPVRHRRIRWTIEFARAEFAKKGFTLTSTEYVRSNDPLEYTCRCGSSCKLSIKDLTIDRENCKACSQKKREATNMERHGAAYPLQVPEFRAKAAATNMERHGAAHPSQVPEFRAKVEATNMERHGAANPLQVPEFQAKAAATMLERHGAANPSQVPEFRAKMEATMRERHGAANSGQVPEFQAKAVATMLERHGAAYPLQVPEFRAKLENTNMIRYGTRHPMQNLAVFQRNQASRFATKQYTFTDGKTVSYQGYEGHAIKLLLEQGVTEEDIVSGYKALKGSIFIFYEWEGNTHRYYPDLYLPSQNKIIEVKSTYTWSVSKMQNVAKLEQTKNQGYMCEAWIITDKGKLDTVITF